MYNRQARVQSQEPKVWQDYGNLSLLEAARREARRYCRDLWTPTIVPIEVQCENSPEIPARVFQVQVDLVATVLDPRGDTDSAEKSAAGR